MIFALQSSILHADDLFMASLWKFKILDMPNLLVNSDLLIDALFVSFDRFSSIFAEKNESFRVLFLSRNSTDGFTLQTACDLTAYREKYWINV